MKLVLNLNEEESKYYHNLIAEIEKWNSISDLIMLAELIYKVSKKEGDI